MEAVLATKTQLCIVRRAISKAQTALTELEAEHRRRVTAARSEMQLLSQTKSDLERELKELVNAPAKEGCAPFNHLPDHLMVSILLFLPVKDLFTQAARVCMRWASLARSNMVWKALHIDITLIKCETGRIAPQPLVNDASSKIVRKLVISKGYVYGGLQDGSIKGWSISEPESANRAVTLSSPFEVEQSIHNRILGIAICDNLLYTGSSHGLICVWQTDRTGATFVRSFKTNTDLFCIAVCSITKRVFVGSWDTVLVFDSAGENLCSLTDPASIVAFSDFGSSVAMNAAIVSSVDGRIYFGGTDSKIHVWDTYLNRERPLVGHAAGVTVLALADGTDGLLYSGAKDNTIRGWSQKGDLQFTTRHAGLVNALTLGPYNRIYSAGHRGIISVYSALGTLLHRFDADFNLVFSMVVADDGTLFFGGTDSKNNIQDFNPQMRILRMQSITST